MGKLWDSAYKISKSSQDTPGRRVIHVNLYTLKKIQGRSQETLLQFWPESYILCTPAGLGT